MVYLLALLSAAFYGAADFTGGFASRRAPMFSVVTISQLAGLLSLLPVLPLLGPASPIGADYAWGAASGLAGGFGVGLLYRALAIGTMGVVAPTTSVCAVLIPVLASLLRGEELPALVTAGIALAVVAIVLLGQESAHPDHPAPRPPQYGLPSGMWHALASGVAIGFFFLLLANARPRRAVAARRRAVAGIPCFAAIVVATGASFRLPRGCVAGHRRRRAGHARQRAVSLGHTLREPRRGGDARVALSRQHGAARARGASRTSEPAASDRNVRSARRGALIVRGG
jgi:uncharacterized membrane protein